MVEVLCVRRREKRNRTNFYCGVVKVCVGSIQYRGIDTFWDRKLCMYFFCQIFFGQNVSEYLKQFSIFQYSTRKNISMLQTKICPRGANFSILLYSVLLVCVCVNLYSSTAREGFFHLQDV